MRSQNLRTHILKMAPVVLAACLGLAGCGPLASPEERAAAQGLSTQNGLSPNGLSQNGLSQNGLSQNGLSQNGLSQNGLSQNGLSSAFSTWFNKDTTTSDVVMQYIVRCAVASGQTRTWTNLATGVTYTWYGALNLAPTWASGSPAPSSEQQLITACLAAHVNRYGVHVSISVQGKNSKGTAIPLSQNELTTYSVQEGCFFGNLFNSDGVFVAADHAAWSLKVSSPRACAFDYKNTAGTTDCTPLAQAGGTCATLCTLDSSGTFYKSCSYNGKSYLPITTRLLPTDVYQCGDGICQFTESCGTGTNAYNSCNDCGPCP
jgi:hypothetical protein